MAYLALYRKYRPMDFDHVIGQDSVVQILKNQIMTDRIGHAYLFTGIRGTGKTSIAKIFARAVNCIDQHDGNPCLECQVCRTINQPGTMDIIEIDAASNRGVDEIRDIREKAVFPPSIGKYKVYIIDEVHMLTKEAFNALLKTLEEPPAHVIFILATTEPNKIPATILSRCQRFDIRPISREMISEQIKWILEDIGVRMTDDAVDLVAQRGDHSMRDALSLLDQVIDIREKDQEITLPQVLDFLGMSDQGAVLTLVQAMLDNDAAECLRVLSALQRKGIDSGILIGQLITCLRELAIVQSVGSNAGDILEMGGSELKTLEKMSRSISGKRIFDMIQDFIEDRQKMRYNEMTDIILEMAVLKQCIPQQDRSVERTKPQVSSSKTEQPIRLSETLSSAIASPKNKISVLEKKEVKADDKAIDEIPPWEAPPIGWDEMPDEPMTDSEMPIPEELMRSHQSVEQHQSEEIQKPVSTRMQSEHHRESDSDLAKTGKADLDVAKKALGQWLSAKDFFTGDIVQRGQLSNQGDGNYVMTYRDPEEKMYSGMFTQELQREVKGVIEKALNRKIRFSVVCTKKKFEDMDMVEKTRAVVGEEYRHLVKAK